MCVCIIFLRFLLSVYKHTYTCTDQECNSNNRFLFVFYLFCDEEEGGAVTSMRTNCCRCERKWVVRFLKAQDIKSITTLASLQT